jgi:ACS family hexuronate transporter-like MFS transporter
VFTSATDLFPAKVSGSVVGLGATTGGLGGMFLTLLAAMSIQWTGNQKMVFIWAGLMHPVSLLIYWLWLRTDFSPADVDAPPDVSRAHAPLLTAGLALAALGTVFVTLIATNWEVCVKAAKLSGATQGATAAGGICLIGLALLYAGLGKKSAATA